jgi:hypothetical protein
LSNSGDLSLPRGDRRAGKQIPIKTICVAIISVFVKTIRGSGSCRYRQTDIRTDGHQENCALAPFMLEFRERQAKG